jgi:hypothetical protein
VTGYIIAGISIQMSDFPTSPDQLTSDWLSRALGYPVGQFEVVFFGEGTGVMAWVMRVLLQTPEGHPDSIIAKFPSPTQTNREVAQLYDMYGREVTFYREIAPHIALRTPACYYAAFEPDTHDFVLLMEDLGDMRIGDQVEGCSLAGAKAVISAIAGFHASGWRPDQFPDLISHNNPVQRDGMVAGFRVGWPVVLEQFGDLIPEDARAAGARVPEAVGRLLDEMCQDPVCLTHADVRLDNVFFGDGEIALVDWQSICTSAPEQDLAYFVTQSVPAAVRAQEDLVAYYHSELVGAGIDYSLDRCRERFAISALYLACYAVVIAGTLDLGNSRGQALGRTIVENTFGALAEIDAFVLLAR